MTKREPALGQTVDIHCRYCRLNLEGVVAAVLDGEVVKVQCRTCRHFQDYRTPVPEVDRKARLMKQALRLRDRRVPSIAPPQETPPQRERPPPMPATEAFTGEFLARKTWDEATQDANPLKARIYNQEHTYGLSDMLVHRTHGLGVVREVRPDGTVVVLFREGYKRLNHGRNETDSIENT